MYFQKANLGCFFYNSINWKILSTAFNKRPHVRLWTMSEDKSRRDSLWKLPNMSTEEPQWRFLHRLHCEIPTGFKMKIISRLLFEAIHRTASRGSKYKFHRVFLLTSDILAVSWASWTLRYFGFLWLQWLDSNNSQWLTESHSVSIQSAVFHQTIIRWAISQGWMDKTGYSIKRIKWRQLVCLWFEKLLHSV